MMKAGLGKTDQLFSPRGVMLDPATHNEDPFHNTMQATTTAASASNGKLELMSLSKCALDFEISWCVAKSMGGTEDGFVLPSINTPASKQSPFKGFLDVSIV